MQPHTTNWCSYTRYIKVVLKYIQELTVNTYLKLAQLRANLVLLLLLMGCKSMSNIHMFLKLRTALSNNACYFYLEKFKKCSWPGGKYNHVYYKKCYNEKKTTCSKMCRAVYAQTQKHESNRRASFHHKKKAQ